jgi:protein-tyrosine phosphatase
VAYDRSQVMAAISHFRFARPIQPVVVNNQELAAMRQEEPAFYAQVKRGIVLWEATDELVS